MSIEFFTWATPNGFKVAMLLEELSLPYEPRPIDITAGEQHQPDFLAISPGGKIPAIVDKNPDDGGPPVPLFESGAILLYLAEKAGRFLPADLRARKTTLEWLFWQVGGLGPMAGQNAHFAQYAPEKIPYAIDRYVGETARLYTVLERRLADNEFVTGPDYTIADIAIYPWIVPHRFQGVEIATFPRVSRWLRTVKERPATRAAYDRIKCLRAGKKEFDDQARQALFGPSTRASGRLT